MRRKVYDSYDLSAKVADGRAQVTVDAIDAGDKFVNELDTELEVIDPATNKTTADRPDGADRRRPLHRRLPDPEVRQLPAQGRAQARRQDRRRVARLGRPVLPARVPAHHARSRAAQARRAGLRRPRPGEARRRSGTPRTRASATRRTCGRGCCSASSACSCSTSTPSACGCSATGRSSSSSSPPASECALRGRPSGPSLAALAKRGANGHRCSWLSAANRQVRAARTAIGAPGSRRSLPELRTAIGVPDSPPDFAKCALRGRPSGPLARGRKMGVCLYARRNPDGRRCARLVGSRALLDIRVRLTRLGVDGWIAHRRCTATRHAARGQPRDRARRAPWCHGRRSRRFLDPALPVDPTDHSTGGAET